MPAAPAPSTDPSRGSAGLSSAQVLESRRLHGANTLPELPHASVWQMFFEALKDKTLLILMGAALLAIGVEVLRPYFEPGHSPDFLDGIAILAAVLIASLVTTLNEARAAVEFRALAKEREAFAVKVERDGVVSEVSVHDLVVGDLTYLSTGDRIPADGQLLNAVELIVDESMLTGESVPVSKGDADPVLRAGTTISGGSGSMILAAVGSQTELGKLQITLTQPEDSPTPLQERLSVLADRIGLFGLGAAILTFLALLISGLARGEIPLVLDFHLGARILEFVILAVTIVVVAVPEGLPLAVTISLAYSVQKMAADKNLVRKLACCEAMGAATVICSDKTGTLTENRMALARLWLGGRWIDPAEAPSQMGELALERFAEIASVNSTAFLERKQGQSRFIGNPTEAALLIAVERWGQDFLRLRVEAQVERQLGFSSERKRMSTLVRRSGQHRLLVKGAPEVLLELSTALWSSDGKLEPLNEERRTAILEAIQSAAAEGQRTLGLAYREWPLEAQPEEPLEAALVFFAVAGIADPVRAEVPHAIRTCFSAGVDVKMVTGDHRIIAESIAREIELLRPDDLVLEGPAFRAMSDVEATRLLPRLRVLARSVPSDKHRLVELLKAAGEVVAVTGDGTNDAPALKFADVGFSMGRGGTEVAKEASDIVILDDNFASIVRAIKWGRSVFENIRKFLQFQLTVNVVALVTAFGSAVFGFGMPLSTVQLLWVNLIMDTLAALALAVEPPTDLLLLQPPHGRHAPLITKAMWLNIFSMSAVMIAILFVVLATPWVLRSDTPEAIRLTFVFNTFVFMQLFNEVNARSTRFYRSAFTGILKSRLFILVVGGTAVIQVLIVELGGRFFRTVPLPAELWGRSLLLGSTMILAGMIVRAFGRKLPSDWYEGSTLRQHPALLAPRPQQR